ncbi:MAG: hypothetical protein ONB48_07990 [candidate division KSB1 bacterium]|nr:hypothetical protein [candidate division KSB1 bacterium]MDZ7274764.1 hypothetical protein [candidate division KSB1 bacterium]MDZ7285588.1 hypothetical protein [candidate division KSB1 bacterium]MDZ7298620.1 hypothetical protein [candidate division KSB1 bacterium]MDZ7349485.1 hypothetical protein [candidate division KSB1 bacterium]
MQLYQKQFTATGVDRTIACKIFYAPPLGWLAVAIRAAFFAEEINLGGKIQEVRICTTPHLKSCLNQILKNKGRENSF